MSSDRRVCRVLFLNEDIVNGIPLPIGSELVKIVPAYEMLETAHWVFIRHNDLEDISRGALIPERKIIVELSEREIGPHTVMKQKIARFA